MIRELSRSIRSIYGRFEFDQTQLFADRQVLGTKLFEYGQIDERTGRRRAIRIVSNGAFDFGDIESLRREMSPELLEQILHIVLKENMNSIGLIEFCRSLFVNPQWTHNLKLRDYPYLEAMHGLFSTITFTQRGAVLLLRNRIRLKERDPAIERMRDSWNWTQEMQFENEQSKMAKYKRRCTDQLNGRYFITLYSARRPRKIDHIDFERNLDDRFECRGQMISYREYFGNVYGEQLQRQNEQIPGMIAVKNRGGRIDYFPPELCYLTGYPKRMRADRKVCAF